MRKDKGGSGGTIINVSSIAGVSNFSMLYKIQSYRLSIHFFREYITIKKINLLKILMWTIFFFGTGLVSLPFIPIYCATKSGVLSYTKAVAVRFLLFIISYISTSDGARAWPIKLT